MPEFPQAPDLDWPAAIRAARRSRGLDQEQLGALVAVSRKTVNAWENRKTPVGGSSQRLLWEVFGDALLQAPAPVTDYERGYWRATVEHIARQTRSIWEQQLALAEQMQRPLPRDDSDQPEAAARPRSPAAPKKSARG